MIELHSLMYLNVITKQTFAHVFKQ